MSLSTDRSPDGPGPSVDRAEFVAAMREVPATVAIVAACVGGERRGLSATAWCSVSADPPMILACVNRNASAQPYILDAGAFTLNVLSTSHIETVAIFSAQRGLDGDARFADGSWSNGLLGQPMLNEALLALECELVDRGDYNTHTIMIGKVIAIERRPNEQALLYVRGEYASANPMAVQAGTPS